MMDLCDRKTIGSVSRWKEDLDSKVDKVSRSHCLLFQAELPDGRQIPALLLANKSDLRHREVRTDQVFLFNCYSSYRVIFFYWFPPKRSKCWRWQNPYQKIENKRMSPKPSLFSRDFAISNT